MTNRSKIILYGILVLVLFCGGIFAGYYVWGISDGEKPDYPALLEGAAKYVASLEQQNSELEAQLKSGGMSEPATGDTSEPATGEPATMEKAADDRVKSLQMKLESLQEEKAALQSAVRSDKTATEKNLELTDRIQALIQAKNTIEQENASLRTQISQTQERTTENDQLKAQIASLTDEKTRLEEKNTALQANGSQNQQLVAENEELKQQVQTCFDRKAELEKENAALQSAMSQSRELMAENQKLKITIASNVDEINTLKLRLNEIRSITNVKETSDRQSAQGEASSSP